MPKGRHRGIRYWDRQGGGYFTTINGSKLPLALGPKDEPDGPTYLAALDQYAKLNRLETGKGTDSYALSAIANQYRIFLSNRHPHRLESFEDYAEDFFTRHADMPCHELRPFHIYEWLDSHAGWADGTKRVAGSKVLACYNWAAESGLIETNRLARRVKLPEPHFRGREMRLPVPLCDLLLDHAPNPSLRLFLRTLYATGCRPVELRMADIQDFYGDRILLRWNADGYRWKNAVKVKQDRTIFLPPDVSQEFLRRPRGRERSPLLPTPRGKRYTDDNVRKRLGLVVRLPEVQRFIRAHALEEKEITPYSFRHTFASEWLDSGRSIKILADLMGTSVRMLERVYGHPDEKKLQQHYLRFAAGQGKPTKAESRPA